MKVVRSGDGRQQVQLPAPGRATYAASLPERSEIRLEAENADEELCVRRDGEAVIVVWTRKRSKERA